MALKITPEAKELMVSLYNKGWTYDALMEKFHVSVATVRRHLDPLHRTKRELRIELQELRDKNSTLKQKIWKLEKQLTILKKAIHIVEESK